MKNVPNERTVAVTWRLSGLARRLVTLALAALLIGVLTRRPEFVGLAAPALLLMMPRRSRRPATIGLTVSGTGQLTEHENGTILARINGHTDGIVQLRLQPARWIIAGRVEVDADGWHRVPFRC